MDLEQRLRRAVEHQTDFLEPWSADSSAALRGAARRRVQRRVASGVGALVVAGAVALAAAGTTSRQDSGPPPVLERDKVVVPDVRPENVVVTPTVTGPPAVGERVRGSMSSDDPDYADDGEVSVATRIVGEVGWELSCRGAPDTFYVLTLEPNAEYVESGRCDLTEPKRMGPGTPFFIAPSDQPVPEPSTRTLRLFLTEEDPREFRECFEYSPPEGCDHVEPEHATPSMAEFGVRLLDSPRAPVAVSVLGWDVPAAVDFSGTTYRTTLVVTGATGARRLTYRLAPSSRERIVQALPDAGSDWAVEDHGLVLSIDGRPVDDQYEGALSPVAGSAILPAGQGHEVTLVRQTGAGVVGLALVVVEEEEG